MVTDVNSNRIVRVGFKFEVIPELYFIVYVLFSPLKFPLVWSSIFRLCPRRLLRLHRIFYLLICAVLPPPLCAIAFQVQNCHTVECVSFSSLWHYWVCLIRLGHKSYSFQIENWLLAPGFYSSNVFLFSACNEVSSVSMQGTHSKGVTSFWDDNLRGNRKQSKNYVLVFVLTAGKNKASVTEL